MGMLGAREMVEGEAPALHSTRRAARRAAPASSSRGSTCSPTATRGRSRPAAAPAAAPALALSVGLLGVASPAELEGIVAHELAHLRHRDVLVQTVAVIVATTIVESSRIGGALQRALLFVLGPLAAAFVHLLLSPKREFEADRLAAELCDSPHGLADALLRLEQAMELVAVRGEPGDRAALHDEPVRRGGPRRRSS